MTASTKATTSVPDYGSKTGPPSLSFGSQGGGGNGVFIHPYCVACKSNGDIILADTDNHHIQVFDPQGGFLRAFGSPHNRDAGAEGRLDRLHGVAVDAVKGNYVVADFGNHRVQVFDRDGRLVKAFGSKGSRRGELNAPYGVGLASNGNVVVSEFEGNRLQVFDSEGNSVRVMATGLWALLMGTALRNPCHLWVNADDDILVADWGNHQIQVFNQRGNIS